MSECRYGTQEGFILIIRNPGRDVPLEISLGF